ncbi:MAG: DedA family protein [Gammaproteobacteria bacterium]|nr:DedA family protein [Gammaproteobacteria bacterium]MDH5628794.1 DedA family protein [Gammaproteobacteria bacterium]
MPEQIVEFINNNIEWASLIVFAIAFLESMAIVGLLMPGWVLLLAIGGLIGGDVLPFYPIVIAAYLGAVIGEYISYYVGYHYHEKFLQIRFFSERKKLIEKGRVFFKKHGILGVFVSRFFGPARAVIPLVAGICEMKKRHFIWVNLVSGMIWAPAYLIPGILLGAAVSVDKQQSYIMLAFIVLISGSMVASYKSFRKWQNNEKEKSGLPIMSIIHALLSLMILVYFVQSEYWKSFKEIIMTVVSKL